MSQKQETASQKKKCISKICTTFDLVYRAYAYLHVLNLANIILIIQHKNYIIRQREYHTFYALHFIPRKLLICKHGSSSHINIQMPLSVSHALQSYFS